MCSTICFSHIHSSWEKPLYLILPVLSHRTELKSSSMVPLNRDCLINQREVLQRFSNITLLCSKACSSVPAKAGSWMSPKFTLSKSSSSSDPSSPWLLKMLLWARFSPLIHLSCSSLSLGLHCREGGKSHSPACEGVGWEHQVFACWKMGISAFPFPLPLWIYQHHLDFTHLHRSQHSGSLIWDTLYPFKLIRKHKTNTPADYKPDDI